MYITYTEDDRIIISVKRLTKKDVENFTKQGIEFADDYDDIVYEKHTDAVVVETSTHLSVDSL